jgi:hypothetical protein
MKGLHKKGSLDKKYVFFVSHSTDDVCSDVGVICEILEKCKIPSFVADRDAPLGQALPAIIMRAIEESDLFLVFLTKNSRKSPWVNQEIGYALGRDIPVIPLKKGRIEFKGLVESAKYVKMQDNPLDTTREVFARLKGIPLSPTAESAILAFIGALDLKDKYGVIKK